MFCGQGLADLEMVSVCTTLYAVHDNIGGTVEKAAVCFGGGELKIA